MDPSPRDVNGERVLRMIRRVAFQRRQQAGRRIRRIGPAHAQHSFGFIHGRRRPLGGQIREYHLHIDLRQRRLCDGIIRIVRQDVRERLAGLLLLLQRAVQHAHRQPGGVVVRGSLHDARVKSDGFVITLQFVINLRQADQ